MEWSRCEGGRGIHLSPVPSFMSREWHSGHLQVLARALVMVYTIVGIHHRQCSHTTEIKRL